MDCNQLSNKLSGDSILSALIDKCPAVLSGGTCGVSHRDTLDRGLDARGLAFAANADFASLIVTSHSSQGQAVERVLIHVNTDKTRHRT